MSDEIAIENVVATAELGVPLDLAALEGPLEADPFDPKRFPGLVVRSRGTTFLLYADGRVRMTGPKAPDDAKRRLLALAEKIRASGTRPDEKVRFWMDNVVVSTDLGTQAPLDQIALALGEERTAFDPEAFPGLVHRVQDPPVTILLFTSGKLVATGIGDLDLMRSTVRDFTSMLRQRRLVQTGAPPVAAEGS